jgi:hypothetical protein
MKQYITIEDLNGLNSYQRDRLNDIWIPQRYDLAAGYLCTDAENNKYDIFEFVIGHVNITEGRAGYHMTLVNLEAMKGWGAASGKEEEEEAASEEVNFDDFDEEDFSFEYERPDVYGKSDCMPLLNIGQMLELLAKCGYGNGNFYASLDKGNNEYGVGRDAAQFIDFGMDFKGDELCDALWAAVKEAL